MVTATAIKTKEDIMKIIEEYIFEEKYNDLKQEFGGGADLTGIGGTDGFVVTDDGTNLIVSRSGVTVFKIRKSDNQLLLDSGITDEAF